ncbi:MAG: hypothetical protein LBK61_01605 [Spirochaetaceae bacterium]|nr:hypothetical protein [Spirochaetaceae bacterium]
MKRKDLIRKPEAAGDRLDRTGNHAIYEKPGNRPVQVPNHREINNLALKGEVVVFQWWLDSGFHTLITP